MSIQYPETIHLEKLSNDFNGYDSEQGNPFKRITAKTLFSSPREINLYEAKLWEPQRFVSTKSVALKGGFSAVCEYTGGTLALSLNNQTGMDLSDAFILYRGQVVSLKDIPKDTERKIVIDTKDQSQFQLPDTYLNQKYFNFNQFQGQVTQKDNEKIRMRQILGTFVDQMMPGSMLIPTSVTLVAINKSQTSDDILVNGRKPKIYNTNVVNINFDYQITKGSSMFYSRGMIIPTFDNSDIAYSTGNALLSVMRSGDLQFKFKIPSVLAVKKAIIYSDYLKAAGQNGVSRNGNTYKSFVFNQKTKTWQSFENEMALTPIEDYISPDMLMEVKVESNVGAMNKGEPDLKLPEIYLEGEAK